ncbi:hypothetical protein ACFPN1_01835 [Lysobacter yangpyeongensis]|uniref:Lipoprotein n=1 Tax=Lysobacter yangpyeongensis TaxID=346182 RepID=A0ABW0SJN0_9GAMM
MNDRAPLRLLLPIAAVMAAMFVGGCTPQASIEAECRAHPVVMPAQPLRTDGYYAATAALRGEDALDWAARMLLRRGFEQVETDGRAFASVAGGHPAYARLRIGRGEGECAAMHAHLEGMHPQRRGSFTRQLADMGMRPSECLVVEPRDVPGSRYRLEALDLSPRRHWYDGITARYLLRTDYRLRDTRAPDVAPPLAHIRSTTLSYQVTVSGYPVYGCGRTRELRRLQEELLQPLHPGREPAAVSGSPESASTASASTASIVRAASAPFAVVAERPLQVLSRQPGTGAIDWREHNRLGEVRPPPLANATVSTAGGWTLRLAGADDRWHEVPLPWISERTEATADAERMYVDQPFWLLATPRGGVAFFAIWRRVYDGGTGAARLTYAEYDATGTPLRRIEAPLPLAAGVNPFMAHPGVPQWDGNALRFRVIELATPPVGAAERGTYPLVRTSEYRWDVLD